jgi:hypothetical protein
VCSEAACRDPDGNELAFGGAAFNTVVIAVSVAAVRG